MRHQIRAMLNQLAESGRLGNPELESAEEAGAPAELQGKRQTPARAASTLRKAQLSAAQQQQA